MLGKLQWRAAALGALLLLPVSVWAQRQPQRDRDQALEASRRLATELQKANFHSGPWYLLSQFQLADIGYGETFYVPTGESGGGLSIAVEAPQKLYLIPHKKVALSAQVTPGYAFFTGSNQKNQFNYSARGDAQFLFNHLYLDLYGTKADALRSRASDINRLLTAKESEVGLNGELKFSSKTSALFETRYADIAFPANRVQPRNVPVNLYEHDAVEERVSFLHKTLPRTSLFVAAEHGDYRFARATYKDSQRTYFAPGFRFRGHFLSLNAEAGPARLEFDDPAQHDYSGVFGQVGATVAGERTTFNFNADRDADFTVFANNNYYIVDRATAAIERAVTRRFSVRAMTTGERDSYDVPVDGHMRRDTIQFHAVGWRYTLRRIRGGFDVGYYQRTSTYGGDEDDGIRIIVNLSITP